MGTKKYFLVIFRAPGKRLRQQLNLQSGQSKTKKSFQDPEPEQSMISLKSLVSSHSF